MNRLADQVTGPVLASRDEGNAADHVRALDVVTADGRLRHVTPDREPDLTGMEIDLLPVTTLYGGALIFPGERADDVFRAYLRWTASVPESMNSSIALIPLPDVPAIPEPLRGRHTVHVRIASPADDPGDCERLVAPLRSLGPVVDTLGKLPYTEAGPIHNDPVAPSAVESDTAMLGDPDDAAVDTILALAGPTRRSRTSSNSATSAAGSPRRCAPPTAPPTTSG